MNYLKNILDEDSALWLAQDIDKMILNSLITFGMGNQIIIDLTSLPDGTLFFVNHNGDLHSGILKKVANSQ